MPNRSTNVFGRSLLRLYAAVLLLVSIVLLCGGVYLLSLDGSPYYAVAGGLSLAAGIGLWRGRTEGALAYILLLMITLVWALWESGTNGWALTARLVAPLVLAIPLPFLLVRGVLSYGVPAVQRVGMSRLLMTSFSLTLLGAFVAIAVRPTDPVDPIYQAGMVEGAIPFPPASIRPDPADADWLHYGGDAGGTRFSTLDQITPANVENLQEAWRVHIGPTSGLETTPIKAGGALFVCNAYNDVIAIDAETGRQLWRFNAHVDLNKVPYKVCRGVAYFKSPDAIGECAERIIANTIDARLIALDARTGKRCAGFGVNGQVSLLEGLGHDHANFYAVTSAPTIVRGRVVLGGWVSDGMRWGEPAGVVRAFDAMTGALSWAWDIGRPDRQTLPPSAETYTQSTPNAWAPFSADEKLGLVYVPTGNPAVDYYGGERRPFDEKFGSSVVAIDAETGKSRWSFQTVHHDLWDWDVASQPTLIDLPVGGRMRPALIQATKRGEVFVLDRETGQAIKRVEERSVPQGGTVPGERLSATQPFSVAMPSFRGPDLTEKTMWGMTPIDQLWCRIEFREARYEGTATPPGFKPSIAYPGFNGGIDWGSVAVDPVRHLLFVNSNRVPNYDQIITREEADRRGFGKVTKHGALNAPQFNTPYATIVRVFTSPLDIPCNQPPYGMLAAVDLKSGKLIWSQSFGAATKAGPLGMRSGLPFTIGTPNNGGSLITANGVMFIGATQDSRFRAIEASTGRLLWQTDLGAGGQATPITYTSPASGDQFIAIAAGGNPILGSVLGDYLIGFRLKK